MPPVWKNTMSNIPLLPQKERVYKLRKGRSGFKLLMRSEQSHTTYMSNFMQKCMNPGNLVLDACAGAFSAAKAFMSLRKHRRFAGF